MIAPRWILRPAYVAPAAAYAIAAAAMWPVPVFGLLHVESAAVVAGLGFFVAGLSSLTLFRKGEGLGLALVRHAGLLAIPWLLLTVTLLWRPNCGYFQGLLLFLTFAVPSVALGVAGAYALDGMRSAWRYVLFVVAGLVVATVPVLYDLGLHPQLYSYNHVWGGVLGPLYDEELAIRPGLFFFRGLTLWWAAALVLVGRRSRMRRRERPAEDARRHGLGLVATALVIAGTYAAAPWLGINSPAWYIQQQLGGHLQLDRFDIYYDPERISEGELRVIADVHAYRYRQLRRELGADVPLRIATYLYPDEATKAALTGSRSTSVAPTWLPVPQIHMLQDRFEGSFAHELAHVVAREFGMPFLRASPAVGLVEGLAVAVEPPDGLPGVHAQVAAALRHRETLGLFGDSLAAGVASQLQPFGFWTGRGAVGYVTMGSFVRYLLDAYGIDQVQTAYRTGRIEAAFGKPVEALAREWELFVREQPVDPEAAALVMARFARPSLFERRCPHHVPATTRHLRRGRAAFAAGDARGAEQAFDAALRADSLNEAVLAAWGGAHLARGQIEDVRRRLERAVERTDTLASTALLARLGDARRLSGDDVGADSAYAAALRRLPSYAREARATLAMRARLPSETLSILQQPLAAAERAAQLEEAPRGVGFAALLWAEAGQFDRAYALMQETAELLPAGERLALLSAYAHAMGDRTLAAVHAQQAVSALRAEGATAPARRQEDRAALLSWIALRDAEGGPANVRNP